MVALLMDERRRLACEQLFGIFMAQRLWKLRPQPTKKSNGSNINAQMSRILRFHLYSYWSLTFAFESLPYQSEQHFTTEIAERRWLVWMNEQRVRPQNFWFVRQGISLKEKKYGVNEGEIRNCDLAKLRCSRSHQTVPLPPACRPRSQTQHLSAEECFVSCSRDERAIVFHLGDSVHAQETINDNAANIKNSTCIQKFLMTTTLGRGSVGKSAMSVFNCHNDLIFVITV